MNVLGVEVDSTNIANVFVQCTFEPGYNCTADYGTDPSPGLQWYLLHPGPSIHYCPLPRAPKRHNLLLHCASWEQFSVCESTWNIPNRWVYKLWSTIDIEIGYKKKEWSLDDWVHVGWMHFNSVTLFLPTLIPSSHLVFPFPQYSPFSLSLHSDHTLYWCNCWHCSGSHCPLCAGGHHLCLWWAVVCYC